MPSKYDVVGSRTGVSSDGVDDLGMSRRHRTTRRSAPVWAVVLLSLALALSAMPTATAQDGSSAPRDQLQWTERRASEIDRLAEDVEADLARAEQRLAKLAVELERVSVRLNEAVEAERTAERRAQDAETRLRRVQADIEAAQAEQRRVDAQLQELARESYVHGRSSVAPVATALDALNDGDLADRLHYLERTVGAKAATVEASEALTLRLARLQERARAERDTAADEAAKAEDAAEQVAATHARVSQLADEASAEQARLEQRLADLAAQREQLATDADRLHDTIEAEKAAARRTAEQTTGRVATSSSGSSGSGVVTVGGITIAASIAPNVEALLNAARADGIELRGAGFRSPEVTAQLRRANGCPDVYESPASACRIPTARPGSSEHEKGLAIDFTWRGETICYPRSSGRCHGNAAFDWLRANASRYGLTSLPSEAWHWSTTGG